MPMAAKSAPMVAQPPIRPFAGRAGDLDDGPALALLTKKLAVPKLVLLTLPRVSEAASWWCRRHTA